MIVRDVSVPYVDKKGVQKTQTLSALCVGGVWCFHPSLFGSGWDVRHKNPDTDIVIKCISQEAAERVANIMALTLPGYSPPEVMDDDITEEEVYEDTLLKVTLNRLSEWGKHDREYTGLKPTTQLALMMVLLEQIRVQPTNKVDLYVQKTQTIFDYIKKNRDKTIDKSAVESIESALDCIYLYRQSIRALWLQAGVYPD